jgi:preprotein translocase subunit SecE
MSVKETVTRYWSETQLEIKKVAWPTKEEMIGSTIATIVISSILALFVWIVDIGVSKAVIGLFRALG